MTKEISLVFHIVSFIFSIVLMYISENRMKKVTTVM